MISRKRNVSGPLIPGSVGFTIAMSLSMATTALAIDTILPAFDPIREQLGSAPGSTDVALLISAFMVGLGLGQLPAGLLADRFGRRPVLWGGVAVYVVGAILTAIAPSLLTMAFGRFLWGLGAAGPRVAVTAMVRDAFEGEEMAKQMSTIMAVFLLVPMFAPSLGAALVAVGPWQLSIWLCVAVGVLVLAVSSRLPATLPPEKRRELNVHEVVGGWKLVFAARTTVPYLAAITLATGVFLSYLASSENIFDQVFGLGRWFPIIFGCVALGFAVGAMVNGRIVESVGLDRMLLGSTGAFVVFSALMSAISVGTFGTPPFVIFAPVMLAALMALQIMLINANTAAMLPLGRVAGSGAALFGMVPLVGGSVIGTLIDRQFDGSITPLSLAFSAASVAVFLLVRVAVRAGSLERLRAIDVENREIQQVPAGAAGQ